MRQFPDWREWAAGHWVFVQAGSRRLILYELIHEVIQMRKLLLRKLLLIATSLLLLPIASANAGDLGVNVIVAGELRPGLYGQVELGNAPRPRMVYDYPVMVREERVYRYAEPVYLHVPPAYISNWSHHCGYYHACGRRVYFVRSVEYDDYYRGHDHHHHYDKPHHHQQKHRGHKHRHHEHRGHGRHRD